MRTAIFFLMNLSYALGRLLEGPRNAVVIAGEGLSMECRTGEESRVKKWNLFDTKHVTTTVYVHSSKQIHQNFDDHFGAEVNANGSGILYTNSTQMKDAGNYTCIAVIDNRDARFSAQLIIFESEPICETNFTRNSSESLSVGDQIWMSCSVAFRGFWTPTFEWRQHWKDEETGINRSERITAGIKLVQSPNHNVTSTLFISINLSTNGSYFSSKISFADHDDKGSNTTATNLPNFKHKSWESDVIQLAHSSLQSDVTVSSAGTNFDEKTPLSTDKLSSREEPESDRYFALLMIVAGLSLFLVLIVIVAVAFCIHYKRKVSGSSSASTAAMDKAVEGKNRQSTTIYDIIPYAVTDNYETIDEMEIQDIATTEFQERKRDPHAAQNYSGLLPSQPTPPAVYSRIDNKPSDVHFTDPNVQNISEGIPEKSGEGGSAVEPPPYLELSGDLTNKHLVDDKTGHSLLCVGPTIADNLDETGVDSIHSNRGSPSSYINVNYETPQLPVTLLQGSPTKTSAYTSLLSTRKPEQGSSGIPIVN